VFHFKTNPKIKKILKKINFNLNVKYRSAKQNANESVLDTKLEMTCVNSIEELIRGENKPIRDEVEYVRNAYTIDDAMKSFTSGKIEIAKQSLEKRIKEFEPYAKRSNNKKLNDQMSELKNTRIKIDELEKYGYKSKASKGFSKGIRSKSKKIQKKGKSRSKGKPFFK